MDSNTTVREVVVVAEVEVRSDEAVVDCILMSSDELDLCKASLVEAGAF